MAKTNKQVAITKPDASLISRLLAAFEQARHTDEQGREYWLAREFAEILDYGQWRNFEAVIERAKAACVAEGGSVDDHFAHVRKMVGLGSGSERDIGDIELTRRACYLIGINGDPRKKDTAAAIQKYFVDQTRKQELHEMLQAVGEDRDRLEACAKLAETEKELKAEVSSRVTRPDEHYEKIKKRGHEALFNKSPDKVRDDLGVPEGRDISDFAHPVVVKGMDFAASLTDHELKKDVSIKGVKKIGDINVKNHQGVRRVMVEGGAPPEKIGPVGDIRDVQARLEKRNAKLLKKNSDNRLK